MQHLIERAITVALNAHAGQKDKAGAPYILHPLRLMLEFGDEDAATVAVLHDVIEDSKTTRDDLIGMGFPIQVVDAVHCLTKMPDEPYEDFIKRIATNSLARKVKIADLRDNLNLARLQTVTPEDLERAAKYHRAVQYLKSFAQ